MRTGTNPTDESDVGTDQVKPETKQPSLYQIVVINDDYTPMTFVVEVLERHFGMSRECATEVMLAVHYHGKGVCGIYSLDIAEMKVSQVTNEARMNDYPLRCTYEAIQD